MKAFYKLVLKGSALSALVALTLAAGCSDTKDDNGGTAGTGAEAGETNSKAGETGNGAAGDKGSTAGSGGAGTAGSLNSPGGEGGNAVGGSPELTQGGASDVTHAAGGADALGEGGASTGPTTAKFCNTLTFGDEDTTMILEIGTGAKKVSLTAKSGTCTPVDKAACKEIETGEAVNIALFDADDPTTALDEATSKIGAGREIVFYNEVDNGNPIYAGFSLGDTDPVCSAFKYSDL